MFNSSIDSITVSTLCDCESSPLMISGGFFNTHFPGWLSWAKYLSLVHYPYAAMVTAILGNIDPIRLVFINVGYYGKYYRSN